MLFHYSIDPVLTINLSQLMPQCLILPQGVKYIVMKYDSDHRCVSIPIYGVYTVCEIFHQVCV